MAVEEYLIPKADTFAAHLYQKSPLCEAAVYNVLHALSMALFSALYLATHMIIKPKNKYLALILPPLVIRDLLQKRRDEGKLIIVTSHHRDYIEAICDHTMTMQDGILKSA